MKFYLPPPRAFALLALLSWLTLSTFAHAADRPLISPAHHPDFPTNKPCTTCHGADKFRPIKKSSAHISSAECVTCHSLVDKKIESLTARPNLLLRVAAPPAPNKLEQNISPKIEPPQAANLLTELPAGTAGMRYPLYYVGSRIGATPNEMVRVPAGEFLRGSNTRLADEGPQHSVTLPAFLIDQYEVTNLQYKAFMRATQHKSPTHFSNRTHPEDKADHPVTFVSWHDARDYCAWAGKRLPTDAEWEKAARATDGRTFPWGDKFALHNANTPARWASLKNTGDTTPVGSFTAGISPYGAYDMSGNVWEWTDSWYTAYPGNTRASENYGEQYKTLKGGSWWDCSFYECGISAPVFNRAFFDPRVKNATFGFRCAKDLVEPNDINNGTNKNAN